MKYYSRHVDRELMEWKVSSQRKPLLVRGARQVGKSTAIRELGKQFQYFVEINLEKQPTLQALFAKDINVKKTCEELSLIVNIPIVAGQTLLFIDEIQVCQEAMMALRYFKEDYPELHVIAAGSLLEFALEELPSFAVGRIRSLYLYPFSFDEFLLAQGLDALVEFKRKASSAESLFEGIHRKLIDQLRSFYLVGGMPAAVSEWIESKSYLSCVRVHNDILDTYQDDFSKYKKRVSPVLLRKVLRSVALQAGNKFVYAQVDNDIRSAQIKDALRLLTLAGLVIPVKHSDANGLPLGAEENDNYTKYLFMDLGLMQTMLSIPAADVLLSSDTDLVNKGAMSEIFAGLEMIKYQDCFRKAEMYYWQTTSRNGNAEIDYLQARNGQILPVEIKASTSGSMQSLWLFMRKKHLAQAIRCSLENFGTFNYIDAQDEGSVRNVEICPLYALSTIKR